MTNFAKGRMSPFVLAVSRAALTMGQGENPVFRITKKPQSETGVKNHVICHRFSMALNFHD